MKYYILSPWWVSGGPEALHQLCSGLNELKKDGYILYENGSPTVIPEYSDYNIKVASISNVYPFSSCVIIPEHYNPSVFSYFKNSKIVYWWLAKSVQWNLNEAWTKTSLMACQSNHAKLHLKENNINSIMLTDYIKELYHQDEKYLESLFDKKENIVLYNPKKGKDITDEISKACENFDIKFIPLENMTRNELKSLGLKSKIYIDFGGHPGKDRLPREMASLGCCIVTGNDGSAENELDVPLKETKFNKNTNYNYQEIGNKIQDIVLNYEKYFNSKEMKNYRMSIKNEKQNFMNEIKNMCSLIEV